MCKMCKISDERGQNCKLLPEKFVVRTDKQFNARKLFT